MAKNIIICLDGSGREFARDNTNVVAVFRTLELASGEQVAYYDPGVGTMGDPSYKTWIARKITRILGLAFGLGLTKNIIEAYTFLMEHYEDGDKIFLFGFSRGAYTARALAGFIKEYGLFTKGSHNLIPYAVRLFKKRAPWGKKAKQKFFQVRSSFRSTYGRKFAKKNPRPGHNPWHYQLPIEFMGLFDTVKSYGWVRNPKFHRNEKKNPSVRHLRHALAIDERRRFFRQMHWTSSIKKECTVKEVWFAGFHENVGGGLPEKQAGLTKVALEWMIQEACAKGMKVDPYRYQLQVLGMVPCKDGGPGLKRLEGHTTPDPNAKASESLRGWWWLVQFIPRVGEPWEERGWRRTIKGEKDRLPRHTSPEPLWVHQSVVDRMQAVPGYRPRNLVGRTSSRWFAEAKTVPAELPDSCEVEQTIDSGDPREHPVDLSAAHEALVKRLDELEKRQMPTLKKRVERIAMDAGKLATEAAVIEQHTEVDRRLKVLEERSEVEPPLLRRNRGDIKAELLAGDLYQAILRKKPTENELERLKAELEGKELADHVEAITRLVDAHWTDRVEAEVSRRKSKETPEWKLLRDQLWQGLLKRGFSSWDYTGDYDKLLKDRTKGKEAIRKKNFVDIIIELVQLPEYSEKLESRIDERQARDRVGQISPRRS